MVEQSRRNTIITKKILKEINDIKRYIHGKTYRQHVILLHIIMTLLTCKLFGKRLMRIYLY